MPARKPRKKRLIEPLDIRSQASPLGQFWQPLFELPVAFPRIYFDIAMGNIIRHPNVNSTILMRADIYQEFVNDTTHYSKPRKVDLSDTWLTHNLGDTEPRVYTIPGYHVTSYLVRRNVPRNPSRDCVTNQTCALYTDFTDSDRLVVYVPHLLDPEACPFYLPQARAVALLYHVDHRGATCSVHYMLWDDTPPLLARDMSDRLVRIGLHLLDTCIKHSMGSQSGYRKRVSHDQIIDRIAFQDKYIELKHKYSAALMANWVEKTDPTKHIFEDLGIAAFLIQLWASMYESASDFEFVDLGCGNGLLVHILVSEGFRGRGLDARRRKSWETYPPEIQDCLEERLVVPGVLKGDLPEFDREDPYLHFVDSAPDNTFYIGNHSDELTLWLPLLDRPFIAIPCCSHNLSGAKHRFVNRGHAQVSEYAALVQKVAQLAEKAGWKVEQEMLRIPSTRNAAIIGRKKTGMGVNVAQLVSDEGGAAAWVETTRKLRNTISGH